MNLHSKNPFFILNTPINHSYPSLNENIKTEVLIIGGGISAAIIAWELYHANIDIAIIDKRHIGLGSTAASTGLLQYEIDVPLHQLTDKVGLKDAGLSYLLCREAIYQIKNICEKLKVDSGFKLYPSFQFASKKEDAALLQKEHYLRSLIGIQCEYLERDEIINKFGFDKQGGIFSEDGAIINAYKFTLNIFAYLHEKGVKIFNNTEAIDINYHNKDVITNTSEEFKIHSKKVVVACGYESNTFLNKRKENLLSTYALITEPLPNENLWYKNSLIWETKNPYLYIRKFDEHRIIMGGSDDQFYNTEKRNKNLSYKTEQILKQFEKLFPDIPVKQDFSWAGTFASTPDGLPYISRAPYSNKVWLALCFGGNGITFSMIAANIIRDEFTGKNNPNKELFTMNR